MSEQDYLDITAESYGNEIGTVDREFVSHYSLEMARPYLENIESVLLMGVGDSYIADSVSQLPIKTTIVEGSSKLVKRYRVLNRRCHIVNTLFEDFKPDTSYDLILGTHILEHVSDPVQVIRQTTNWLSRNGISIFTVPNGNSLHRQIGKEMGLLQKTSDLNANDISLGHRRVYTSDKFRHDIEMAGYREILIKGYLLKIVPNKMMLDWDRKLLDGLFVVSQNLPVDICADLFAVCHL